MTSNKAERQCGALRRIADLHDLDIRTWFALVEDGLRSTLPDHSQLLALFTDIRLNLEKQIGVAETEDREREVKQQARAQCRALVRAACELLEAVPLPQEDLEDEIERVIQKGYFKSVYFRVIAALFGVALAIIGGAGGIEVFGQVREMKKLVEDARRQMEESNLEVAKARAESNNRQAELALLIMQGNEQMVKMRASAIEQMSAEELGFKSKVEAETASWASQVEKAGQDAKQEVTRAGDEDIKEINRTAEQSTSDLHKALGMSKTVLAAKLTSTLAETEAAKHPAVSWVVWSMAKTWLVVPAALIIAVLGWLYSFASNRRELNSWMKVLAVANIVVFCATLGVLWWLK